MEKMKDSGLIWVGEIPESWNVLPNKYVMQKSKKICNVWKNENIISLSLNGTIVRDLNAGGKMPATFDGYQYVYPGNLLMCLFDYDVTPRCIGYLSSFGVTSPAYSQYAMLNNNNSKYYYYYYLMVDFTKELLHLAKNLRHSFNEEEFGNIKTIVPPVESQIEIANYLDLKCNEVDSAISRIDKLLQLVSSYKLNLITKAVTTGLNGEKLINSYVSWIGDIPEHFKVIRLKYASWIKGRIGWQGLRADEYKEDTSLPYLITGTDFENGVINWDTCAHITKERYLQDLDIHIEENDLLITKDGTIGKVAIAKNCPKEVSLNSGVFIVRNNGRYKYYYRYMYYILQSNQFLKWFELSNSGNSTIKHLNQEKFYNFAFTFPPLNEQENIANYLDDKCMTLDSVIEKLKKQKQKLYEYKKSIIFEYVTGKKEIKHE